MLTSRLLTELIFGTDVPSASSKLDPWSDASLIQLDNGFLWRSVFNDDALFANALNAKGFRALEALPEQALSGHLDSAAITEACKRRLSAVGSQIKGVVVAQWLDKCSDNESVMMALNWTSGRTKYSASTYPAWLALSKASIPESLLSNVTDWIIEQEVMRQLKEGTLDSIKAFLKQSSAARPLAVLKLRHDELLPPCPDGDRASCALTTISEKLAYLKFNVYLSNCLVCKARTVLENRRPILVKELSSLVRKRCHSIAQTTQRQLVRIVNGKVASVFQVGCGSVTCAKERKECRQSVRRWNRNVRAGMRMPHPNTVFNMTTVWLTPNIRRSHVRWGE